MRWSPHRVLASWRCRVLLQLPRHSTRSIATSTPEVLCLESWSQELFREKAFIPAQPFRLPFQSDQLPPACSKWFIHDNDTGSDLARIIPAVSELCTSFWSDHERTIVPLELNSTAASDGNITFHRTEAPLKILLTYLGNSLSPSSSPLQREHSIYLAQCSLRSLPEPLQADIPTPSLVLKSGKGDVYDSSLWLGRPPTYTPLHRDPNPNLFMQLAGKKVVRLFPPEIGNAIFDQVQEQLQQDHGPGQRSATIRGEEMMAGPERELLHRAVWEDDFEEWVPSIRKYCRQAELRMGEALFIPKGWWHSVKGLGPGITASVNWWFR